MLILPFKAGEGHFALRATQIIEVRPWEPLSPVPQAPPAVAGLLNYRNHPIPVLDLSILLAGQPSRHLLSTRLIVVKDQRGELALMGEQILETRIWPEDHEHNPPLEVPQAPFLGPLVLEDGSMIQLLEVEHILPDALRELFYPERAEA